MKGKVIFVLLVCACINNTFSQEIKLNAGVALSSFKSKKPAFLNDRVTSPVITIGVDYLNHKYWYLSSEAGYMDNGGMEKQLKFLDGSASTGQKIDLKEHWPTLHLNTTFRIKIPVRNSNFFIGTGPVLETVLGNRNPSNDLPGLKANRCSFAIKADAGYEFRLKKGIKLGVAYSYIHTLTPYADYMGKHLFNRTSAFSILFGYQL